LCNNLAAMSTGTDDLPIHDLVRQFPDRAFRWLLELPENVRGLLKLAGLPFVDELDFANMRPVKLSTIHDNLREEIQDVLHEAPLRVAPERTISVYILAEHSSTKMPTARTDLLRGMGNAWLEQELEWERQDTARGERRPKPVVSGVLYTGDDPWEEPPQLAEQLRLPTGIAEYVPSFRMFYVDPARLPEQVLSLSDEPFAWLLSLFKVAKAPREVFLTAFRGVLERLSTLPHRLARQQKRLALIADVMAYHRRPPAERETISGIISDITPRLPALEEVNVVAQTIVEYYLEQGLQRGRQDTLLHLLTHRFGAVPPDLTEKVRSIRDLARLDDLLVRLVDAAGLDDLGLN